MCEICTKMVNEMVNEIIATVPAHRHLKTGKFDEHGRPIFTQKEKELSGDDG